jgi:hypothetical protein
MRIKLLSILLFLLTFTVWSQNKFDADFIISINGNKIATAANFKQQFKDKKLTSKQNPKTEYTLLQFTKIPSVEEQKN